MKKLYQTPRILVESYSQTKNTNSCSAIQISSTSTGCVLADPDSTLGMLDFAVMGGFLNDQDCVIPVPDVDEGDDPLCYHTSSFMAFTS